MRSIWRRYLRVAVLMAVLVVGVQASRGISSTDKHPPAMPGGPSDSSLPGAPELKCLSDPAALPPPLGPEGRPANYLHTCGNRLLDAHGREVRITGVNWSGMEWGGYAPGGLGMRNWQEILDQVAALGYNTVRVPFSSEALEPGRRVGNANWTLNPDLEGLTGLELLDRLVTGARERGLKVILDRHYPTSGGRVNLWYSREVPEERWIADWKMLAARYYGNDTVIGFDLHNEPHGEATWGSGDVATDWLLAAERAGNAVLEVNPNLLIFVEGVENHDGDHFWWGGNLAGVRKDPVRLQVPNRVVFSPHDYGPAISDQSWFRDSRFPENLAEEWDRHWGYIHREGIAPVVVGEFGGWSFGDDPDGQWQRALLGYLQAHPMGALVWSLNPTWDTGGILSGDWQTVDQPKHQAYRVLLAAPIDAGLTGIFGRPRTRPRVLFRQDEPAGSSGEVVFSFRILNDGPDALDLGRVELRYWFRDGDPSTSPERASIEAGELRGSHVLAGFAPTDRGGQDHYLRVTFSGDSQVIERYRASGRVTVRFRKAAAAPAAQSQDYSYAGRPPQGERLQDWDRVTLHLDGQLVGGREP